MISGSIQNVEPPDSSDQRGTQYQYITITDQNGQPNRGRIGAKNPYTMQDIGSQIQVDVEQKQTDKGSYLYFKKHYDKPYSGQQGPPHTQQGTQQARRATNGEDMVRIRSMALAYAKDLMVAGKLKQGEGSLQATAYEFTSYIATGAWLAPNPQETQPNPNYVGDDPPPPDFEVNHAKAKISRTNSQ